MASTLEKTLAGSVCHASSTNNDDAKATVTQRFEFVYDDLDTPAAKTYFIGEALTALDVKAAYVVPAVTQGAQATNYVSIGLSKGDTAAGSLTSLDIITSETALTARTKRSFSVDGDTLDKGDGLSCVITHHGTTTGVIAFTLVVECEPTN